MIINIKRNEEKEKNIRYDLASFAIFRSRDINREKERENKRK